MASTHMASWYNHNSEYVFQTIKDMNYLSCNVNQQNRFLSLYESILYSKKFTSNLTMNMNTLFWALFTLSF